MVANVGIMIIMEKRFPQREVGGQEERRKQPGCSRYTSCILKEL